MDLILLAIPVAPLLAALALVCRRVLRGETDADVVGWVATAATGISLLGVLALSGRDVTVRTTWLQTASHELSVGLESSGLTWFTALLVSVVSLVVMVYSLGYTAEMNGRTRFFAEMSFFVAAMLTLVLANSLLLMFAAWEAVGVASFLLIGFHFRRPDAPGASIRAFVLTRIGDVGFLLAWLILLDKVGTVGIPEILTAAEGRTLPPETLTLIALLLFAAAVGKSAQLPLTAWLPAAMVGPTPVSALIHSATMVAAGVFLVLRLFPIFEAAPVALDVIMWVGLSTAIVAALVATSQVDFKRLLAWSTVSQLGEMFFALGLGAPLAAVFHLVAHAAFKGTLFLTAGAIDHGAGSRDLRRLGGLAPRMPFTTVALMAGALALAGIPPFAGFWTEDHILAAALHESSLLAIALLGLIIAAGFYIGRAVAAILGSWPGAPEPEAHEANKTMLAGSLVLATGAVVVGLALVRWGAEILPFPEEEAAPAGWRSAAVIAGAAGLTAGWILVRRFGPIAPLRVAGLSLEQGVELLVVLPARLAMASSRFVDALERLLDRFVRLLASMATGAAWVVEGVEGGLDRTAVAGGAGTLGVAAGSDLLERKLFADGADSAARRLSLAGAGLRQVQSGRLYLYTLGLFLWVALAGVLSLLRWR